MCGIVGYVVTNRTLYRRNLLRVTANLVSAWNQAEIQGGDAAGIAICRPKEIELYKCNGSVEDLVGSVEWDRKGDATGVIAHTRAATSGSPDLMFNNHPIIAGNTVGVHNGVLYSNELLEGAFDCRYHVDSELLFRVLETMEDDEVAVDLINGNVNGSIAMVWHHLGRPYIGLYTNGGNGLTLHWTDMGVIFFTTKEDWLDRSIVEANHHITSGEFFAIGTQTVVRYKFEESDFLLNRWMEYGSV